MQGVGAIVQSGGIASAFAQSFVKALTGGGQEAGAPDDVVAFFTGGNGAPSHDNTGG